MEEMKSSRLMAIEKLYSQVENDFNSVVKEALKYGDWGGCAIQVCSTTKDTSNLIQDRLIITVAHRQLSWLMYMLRDEINADSGVMPDDIERAGALAKQYISEHQEPIKAKERHPYAKNLLLFVLDALKK